MLDAPLPNEETPTIEEQAREWDVAVNQATTVARQAGKVPAGLNRTLEGAAAARNLAHALIGSMSTGFCRRSSSF